MKCKKINHYVITISSLLFWIMESMRCWNHCIGISIQEQFRAIHKRAVFVECDCREWGWQQVPNVLGRIQIWQMWRLIWVSLEPVSCQLHMIGMDCIVLLKQIKHKFFYLDIYIYMHTSWPLTPIKSLSTLFDRSCFFILWGDLPPFSPAEKLMGKLV